MTIKWRQAIFGLSASTISLPKRLAWKRGLKTGMMKVIPNIIAPKNNIKKGGDCGNGQVSKSDLETVDIPGEDGPQGYMS